MSSSKTTESLKRKREDDGKKKVSQSSFGALSGVLTRDDIGAMLLTKWIFGHDSGLFVRMFRVYVLAGVDDAWLTILARRLSQALTR